MVLLSIYTDVMCEPLDDPENGHVSFDDLSFEAIAEYECDVGYVLDSDPIRVCEGDGVWSGNDPLCLRE